MIARLPVGLRRAGYRVAYVLLMTWSRVFRPHTRGVKCLVACDGELLLVRHSYGPGTWDIPGGFCRRGEEFAAAARREVDEELGIDGARWTDLGEDRREYCGRHETLRYFRVDVDVRGVSVERAELAEVRWFARGELPAARSRIVDRVLARE